MSLFHKSHKVLMLMILACGVANTADAGGWVTKVTGGRIETPPDIQKIAPNGISIKPTPPAASSLGTWFTTRIRDDGVLIEVSSAGHSRATSGRARLERNDHGQAFWVSIGASKSPLRAPQHDTQVQRTVHHQIDPNTGIAYELTYLNGQLKYRKVIHQLYPQYDAQGRPFYQYGSHAVVANNQPWRPSQQRQNARPQHQQPAVRHGGQQVDPGVVLAAGILQAIGQAAQNNR